MAISYEDWKTQYEGMSTDQQAKYANMVKGNATAEEYANRYIQEKQNAGTFGQKTAKSYTNANQPVETPTTRQETPVVNQQPETTTVDVARNETPKVDVIRTETPKKETPVTTVSEIKQEGALAPLSKEYYSQTSDEAQTKIINNLNGYRTSNPEYFTDYETFKKNFSYDARNSEQKNTLDTWYKGYSQGLQLSSTPIADLYTQYKNGSISTGDLESLRIANPEKYAELQQQINKGNIIAAYDDDNQTSDTMFDQLRNTFLQNMITNLNASGSGASSIFDSYKDKMESPEMTELGDEAAAKQEEIEKVSADIDSMKKQVEAEYEGTGASRAKINAIVADRTYDLQLQLRSLNSEYNRIATQYNNRMTQYQDEFKLQLQEYQFNMQERNQKMSELGFAMDLMNYETPQQQQEREWNFWVRQQEYQNGDINSKDYSTRYKAALKGVENLLDQYQGIPMVRSAEQMAQDVLKAIDNGSTLGEELTKINKLIQEKPEYKTLYNNTYGKGSGITSTYNIGGQEYVLYNGELITSEAFNNKFGGKGSSKPYDVVDSKVFENNPYASRDYYTLGEFLNENKTQVGKKGGECAKFVNDYLEKIGVGRYFGKEDITTRASWANSGTPKEGTIAIFDYGHTSSDGINHGHVGIVTKVNKDGSFVVRESNFDTDNPGVITERTVYPGSTSLKGFFDPSKGSTNNTSSKGLDSLSAADRAKAEGYIKQLTMGTMNNADITKYTEWMADRGLGDLWNQAMDQGRAIGLGKEQTKDRDLYIANFQKSEAVKDFEGAKNQFNQLVVALNDASGVGDMSAVFTFMKTLDPSSVVRESEFNSAAETAGILNPSAILQKLEKSADGKFLTPQQRKDFQEIAKEFIKVKVNAYNDEYNYLNKMFEISGIPADYLPQNNAQLLMDRLNGVSTDTMTYQSTNSTGYIDIGQNNAVYNLQKFAVRS